MKEDYFFREIYAIITITKKVEDDDARVGKKREIPQERQIHVLLLDTTA